MPVKACAPAMCNLGFPVVSASSEQKGITSLFQGQSTHTEVLYAVPTPFIAF